MAATLRFIPSLWFDDCQPERPRTANCWKLVKREITPNNDEFSLWLVSKTADLPFMVITDEGFRINENLSVYQTVTDWRTSQAGTSSPFGVACRQNPEVFELLRLDTTLAEDSNKWNEALKSYLGHTRCGRVA